MSESVDKYKDRENYIVPMSIQQRALHLHPIVFREMIDHIKGKRVLHAGCNAGSGTYYLCPLGPAKLVGVDVNAEAIDMAERLVPGADFYTASIHELPFEDNSFDTVIIFAVFEHLFEEDKALAVKEFERVLTPGGKLLLWLPRAVAGSRDQKLRQNAFDPHHFSFYYKEEDVHADFPEWKCVKFYHEDRVNPNGKGQHNAWVGVYENSKSQALGSGLDATENVRVNTGAVPSPSRAQSPTKSKKRRKLGAYMPEPEPQPELEPSEPEPQPEPEPKLEPSEPEPKTKPEPKSAEIRSRFAYPNPHDY